MCKKERGFSFASILASSVFSTSYGREATLFARSGLGRNALNGFMIAIYSQVLYFFQNLLAAKPGKILHQVSGHYYTFNRQRVIHRQTKSAYAAVSFDPV